jgi:hypothetical protein
VDQQSQEPADKPASGMLVRQAVRKLGFGFTPEPGNVRRRVAGRDGGQSPALLPLSGLYGRTARGTQSFLNRFF